MSENNYDQRICEAIEYIVNHAIDNAKYDKTIQATIVSCTDESLGKYRIKYQDSSFYAYSSDPSITYSDNTAVYILVPSNDMSNVKTIIGTVDKLGTDYISDEEEENSYRTVGKNIIENDETYELNSYINATQKILYDRENKINLIKLNTDAAAEYLQLSSSIICGATFRTNLPVEQQFNGNFGVSFTLAFTDTSTGDIVEKNYVIDIDQMDGNPYKLTKASRQYGIFDIDGENFLYITKVMAFAYNFPYQKNNADNDIFIGNIEFSGARIIQEEELNSYYLDFETEDGTFFTITDEDDAELTVKAQVYFQGKKADALNQNVSFYWFKEDSSVDSTSIDYNSYGGRGWSCLNAYTIISSNLVGIEDYETKLPQVYKIWLEYQTKLEEISNITDAEVRNKEQEELLSKYTIMINKVDNMINLSSDITTLTEWVPGKNTLTIKKSDVLSAKIIYKCVAVYSDATIISSTIEIMNKDADTTISLISENGRQFYFGAGSTDLVCFINDEEPDSTYSFKWGYEDKDGNFTLLEESAELNYQYDLYTEKLNELNTGITNGTYIATEVQSQKAEYSAMISSIESQTRIIDNKIYHISAKDIDEYRIYKCTIFKDGIMIGTANSQIYNSTDGNPSFTLTITNGKQAFMYDENGVSPASYSLKNPITIQDLSFTIVSENGVELDDDILENCDIEWVVPTTNTLLYLTTEADSTNEEENTKSYKNVTSLSFSISSLYYANYTNNNIELRIFYQGKLLTATTNFIFTKQGASGTNGTEYICKIIPYEKDGDTTISPCVTTSANDNVTWNYTPGAENQYFQAQLWKGSELIYEGDTSSEDVTVEWEILANTYGDGTDSYVDSSSLSIINDYQVYASSFIEDTPANIVRCIITYQDIKYYAAMPIVTMKMYNDDYLVSLSTNCGFNEVMYTSYGEKPKYNNIYPFGIDIYQKVIKNDQIYLKDISLTNVEYNWSILGRIHNNAGWINIENLKVSNLYLDDLQKNQQIFRPNDTFDGYSVTNAILCTITDSETGELLAQVHMPIYMYLNRYSNSTINGWDGNSVSVDDDGSGVILAPQIGAGRKEEDNSFTGIFMGTVKEYSQTKEKVGLFGYYKGERTIFLNAENGTAFFGKNNGQIIVDPSSAQALLYSKDFWKSYDSVTGLPTSYSESNYNDAGMLIDLTTPAIRFGNGAFSVTPEGLILEDSMVKLSSQSEDTLTNVLKKIDDWQTEADSSFTSIQSNYNEASALIQTTNGISVNTAKSSSNLFYYDNRYWKRIDIANSTDSVLTQVSANTTMLESDDEEFKANTLSGVGYTIWAGAYIQTRRVQSGSYHLNFKYRNAPGVAATHIYGYINNYKPSYGLSGTGCSFSIVADPKLEWQSLEDFFFNVEDSSTLDLVLVVEETLSSNNLIYLADLMVYQGEKDVIKAWNGNPNETRTDTVTIGQGIRVDNSVADTYTRIDADGTTIYNVNTDAEVASFTDVGMRCKQIVVNDTAIINKLLVKLMGTGSNTQIWLTSTGGDE